MNISIYIYIIKNMKKTLNTKNQINVGDFITLGIKVPKKKFFRIQKYSGIIISKKNTKRITTISMLSRYKTIFIKHCFFLQVPNIIILKLHYALKIKRSKLYYLKNK